MKIIQQKKKFVFPIIIFSVLSSIFSGLSIGLIIPLLEGNDRNIFEDTYFKFLDDFLQYGYGGDFQERIIKISIFIIVLSIFEFLFTILIIKLSVRVQYILELEFLEKIFKNIESMKYSKFFSYKDGEIFTIITTDIYNVSNVCTKFLISIQSFILITIYFIIMFSVSPWLTFISIMFFVFISIIVTGLLGRKTKIINSKVATLFLKINSELSYFIENYKKVIGLGVEDKFVKNLRLSYKDLITQRMKYSEYFSYSIPINNLINTVSIAALLLFGSFLFSDQPDSWTVMLIPFLVLLFKILPMVSSLNSLRVLMESNKPFIERLQDFISENSNYLKDGKKNFDLKEKIVFSDISFKFKDKKVLDNVSFEIEKNRITALIGASGVGKTTIIDLILKIYSPDAGEIYIDDDKLSDVSSDSIRNNISYLPQDLLMLNANILDNVNLYGQNISKRSVIENIDRFNFSSESSENLRDLNIGLGGINLSGGQKQKINIIRTILKESEFIIFDEPTNNLDSESIKLFIQELEKIKKERTILLITHDELLINISDVILELNANKIIKK